MKRFLSIVLVFVLAVSLCSCSVEKNDVGFITNLTAALEARWKISTTGKNFADANKYKDHLYKCVDAELSKLGNYSEYTFTDETLAAYAEQYFVALEAQREGIQYYGVDDILYNRLFNLAGYNKRAELIYLLNEYYNLQVNDKNTSFLNDFIAIGEKIYSIQNILEQDLVLEFTGANCEMIIENTTKYDLSGAQISFNFFDDNGVLVNTSQAFIQSWASGSKVKASVYTLNQTFSSAEMSIILLESGIETNYVPVEYINEMIINIETPELPKELSYGYSGNIYSSVIIDDFSYHYNYWSNGKTGVELRFSGTKSFDNDGENAPNSTMFSYKLYDKNNIVVSSGSVYIDKLSVGEAFRDASTYTDQLGVGTYKLVIEDYMY